MKRAVLYSRVSTVMQADFGVSLEMQENMARQLCEREGWEFCGLYTDTESGTRDARPELMRLEEDAGKKRFDIVLVYKTDRLARSLLRLLQIAADFHDRGIGLISLTEPIDFTTPMGKALLAMLGAFAEMEAQNISTRVRDSLRLVAARGGNTGSTTRALGYELDPETKRLAVVPDEAEVVRLIFAKYLEIQSMRAVTLWLNEQGHTTLTGKTFGVNVVRWIIRNPIYKGAMVWGRTTTKKNSKGQRRVVFLPEDKWVIHEGHHEAIIEPAIWQKAQDIAEENQTLPARRIRSRTSAPWSGLLHCRRCGAALNRHPGKFTGRNGAAYASPSYECTTRKNKGPQGCDIALNVSDAYLEVHVVPAMLEAIEAAVSGRPKAKGAKPKRSHAAEIDALRAQIDRAWDAYVKGRPYEWAKAIEEECSAKIAALSAPPEDRVVVALPVIRDLRALWEKSNDAEKRELLRLYVHRAEVDRETFSVHFKPGMDLPDITVPKVSMRGYGGAKNKGKPRPRRNAATD